MPSSSQHPSFQTMKPPSMRRNFDLAFRAPKFLIIQKLVNVFSDPPETKQKKAIICPIVLVKLPAFVVQLRSVKKRGSKRAPGSSEISKAKGHDFRGRF